jgi:hypothetical protein
VCECVWVCGVCVVLCGASECVCECVCLCVCGVSVRVCESECACGARVCGASEYV